MPPPHIVGVMWDRVGRSGQRGHTVGPALQGSTEESQEFKDIARESLPANFSKHQCLVCLCQYKYKSLTLTTEERSIIMFQCSN